MVVKMIYYYSSTRDIRYIYFPDSIMIILRFLPVTDLASYSIAERIIFSEGLVDFLID